MMTSSYKTIDPKMLAIKRSMRRGLSLTSKQRSFIEKNLSDVTLRELSESDEIPAEQRSELMNLMTCLTRKMRDGPQMWDDATVTMEDLVNDLRNLLRTTGTIPEGWPPPRAPVGWSFVMALCEKADVKTFSRAHTTSESFRAYFDCPSFKKVHAVFAATNVKNEALLNHLVDPTNSELYGIKVEETLEELCQESWTLRDDTRYLVWNTICSIRPSSLQRCEDHLLRALDVEGLRQLTAFRSGL